MRTLGLVLALVALVGGACLAAPTTTATITVTPGVWNLIALPNVPIDPAIGGNQPGQDANGVFGAFNTKSGFNMQEWVTSSGAYITYAWQTASVKFGNLLLGAGYWVGGSALTGNVSYTALPDGVPDLDSNSNPVLDSAGYPVCTDMYISLPGQASGGGWQLIGHPFNHTTAMNPSSSQKDGSRILFTDGTNVYGWQAANGQGWVTSTVSRWNATTQSYTSIGYARPINTFSPGLGYWVNTSVSNLAMIIPGMEINQ
jgi:hypothetical protein